MRAFFEKTPSQTSMAERVARYRRMKEDLGSLAAVRVVSGRGPAASTSSFATRQATSFP